MKEKNIRSVMMGHAVGDALGVPFEFSDREVLAASPATDMVGYKCYSVPAGTWSDDTSMSLATLDVLSGGRIDYEKIMQNFADWLFHDRYTATDETFDVGLTCQFSIINYRNHCYTEIFECGLDEEEANGNGSLMRIHPISLYLYYTKENRVDHMDAVHKISSLTHAHQRSKIACGIYSFVLWEILDHPTKESVRIGLEKAREYYGSDSELQYYERLLERIAKAPSSVAPEDIRSSGYVVDTIEAAIWCLLTTDTYKSCVLKAVNLGGDTDTIAAIAGGLAGALYGYDDIPEEWRDAIGKREYIKQMCKTAADRWQIGVC